MNEEEIKRLFVSEMSINKDDHENVKKRLVEEGVPFKSVTRLFNSLSIEYGYALSKENREAIIQFALANKKLNTKRLFEGRIKVLSNKLINVNKKGAAIIIRNYAKNHCLDIYCPPVKITEARVSFHNQFCTFVLENPKATEAKVIKYLTKGRAEYIQRNLKNYLAIWKMAETIREGFKNV